MNETSLKQLKTKKEWQLDSGSFQSLLIYLDEGKNTHGRSYVKMRERLVGYFDRRNCLTPDDLADETLNRVARRLQEEGGIQSDTAAKYCYTVARYVFQEYLRRTQTSTFAHDEIRRQSQNDAPYRQHDEEDTQERMLHCLGDCTDKLDHISRKIISRYYLGKERAKIENRRALAAEVAISMNALSIRACRLREKLESCVRECIGAS